MPGKEQVSPEFDKEASYRTPMTMHMPEKACSLDSMHSYAAKEPERGMHSRVMSGMAFCLVFLPCVLVQK